MIKNEELYAVKNERGHYEIDTARIKFPYLKGMLEEREKLKKISKNVNLSSLNKSKSITPLINWSMYKIKQKVKCHCALFSLKLSNNNQPSHNIYKINCNYLT